MTHLTIGQCATLACLLEVTAPKPGNVHRGADFADLGLNDFLAAAVAIGPIMDRACTQPLGQTVLDAVQATRQLTIANPNLGIILLLAPLAAVPRSANLAEGVQSILAGLGARDADQVYQAIRLADPGGLQPRDHTITRYDVRGPAPSSLLAAMQDAADRDLVARQYTQGFADVLQRVLAWLEPTTPNRPLSERIVHAHIRLMSEEPDSLIARRCGQSVATEAAARATAVLQVGKPGGEAYWRAVSDLDFWLRSDGNRRNPGTTADLIAAALFAGLRDDRLRPPYD